MANNRMFLVHRPTGYAVYLAKNMADGWYDVPYNLNKNIEALFEFIYERRGEEQTAMACDWEDFAIGMEDIERAPAALNLGGYPEYTERLPFGVLRVIVADDRARPEERDQA